MQPRAHRPLSHVAAVAAMLFVLLLAGCASEAPSAETRTRPPRGRIVFDMGHGEIFGAEDTSELGQSQAVARMRDAGYEVVVNPDALTADDLAGASGLVLAGPMMPLKEEEYLAVTSFVERGGTLLLTIHVPYPVMGVPAHWGAPVGAQILMSQSPAAGPAQPSVFFADAIADSPLTDGVSQVLVVSGWPVALVDGGQPLVSTRPDT